ncbi:MAG: hypothetical protein WDM96_04200 [Lacunisphaera sp.]
MRRLEKLRRNRVRGGHRPHSPAAGRAQEAGWENLARQARREWERCFGQATLLPTLTAELRSIQAARRRPERSQRYYFPFRVLPDYMLARARPSSVACSRRAALLKPCPIPGP